MHGILISFVILLIVAAQCFVGYTAWKKIDDYRQIIPEAQNFETVKVYIPESQVKDIDISYILDNLHKFQLPKQEEEQWTEAEIVEDPLYVGDVEWDVPEPDDDEEIWVTRGNEEKKIEYRLWANHELDGWNRI